jgi:transaldolase
MSIFIDSANIQHIETGLDLGWVSGITTNPLILAKAKTPVQQILTTLKELQTGPIFYQLMSETFESMMEEARVAETLLEKQLVVKLPPTDLGFKVCSQLATRIPCCPTAIYSPAQALLARESGAQYLAVYVNRATRLLGDGLALVTEIASVLEGSTTRLLAASLKSPEETMAAFAAGADDLTLPFETLINMAQHDLSAQAVAEFKASGMGLLF